MTVIGEYIPNLLPCPFCGRQPHVDRYCVVDNDWRADDHYVSIECEDCGVKQLTDRLVPYGRVCRLTKAQLIQYNHEHDLFAIQALMKAEKKWNTRPLSPMMKP